MVKEDKKSGSPFQFVLFNIWFSNPAQLVELKGMEVDTIAMVKKSSTKYLWTNPETGVEIKEYFCASETQVEELVCLFISKLPENWKIRFQMPNAA